MDTPEINQPISSTQPTVPPPPPPKKNSGILIGILLLLLGILVGLGIAKTTLLSNLRIPYLSAIPTPTSIPSPAVVPGEAGTQEGTASWQTFTSPNISYSIKFPPDWPLPEIKTLPLEKIASWNETLTIKEGNYTRKNSGQPISYEEWIKYFPPLDSSIHKIEDYQMNGDVGKRFYYQSASKTDVEVIFAKEINATTIFTITYSYEESDQATQKLFDQILSTFRFVGQK